MPQWEPKSTACCLDYIHQRCRELQTGISYLVWRTEIPHQSTTWIKGESNRHSWLAHLSDLSLSLVSTLNLIMQPERSLSSAFIPQGTGGMEHVFPCQRAHGAQDFQGLALRHHWWKRSIILNKAEPDWWSWRGRAEALLPQVQNRAQIYKELLNS